MTRETFGELALPVEVRVRADQRLGVGVGRAGRFAATSEYLTRRPGLNNNSRVHDHDPIAHPLNRREVVRDHHQPEAVVVAQVVQEIEYLRLAYDVEGGRGLVGDQQ
jgi:hypothetical protein